MDPQGVKRTVPDTARAWCESVQPRIYRATFQVSSLIRVHGFSSKKARGTSWILAKDRNSCNPAPICTAFLGVAQSGARHRGWQNQYLIILENNPTGSSGSLFTLLSVEKLHVWTKLDEQAEGAGERVSMPRVNLA